MSVQEHRREHRHSTTREIGVFLSAGRNGPAATAVFQGVLTSISRNGAGIALNEIMAGKIHLAYGPMESHALQLNLVLPSPEGDLPWIIPARPVWLNKESGTDFPPFRLGLEFAEPLSGAILQYLNRQFR